MIIALKIQKIRSTSATQTSIGPIVHHDQRVGSVMTRHQGVRAEHQVEQCGAWEKSPNSWEILVQAGLS